MATKKNKGLGRGLEALIAPEPATNPAGAPMLLPLHDICPGQYQPRTHMDEGALYELAESIRSQGIMQPILVRQLAQPRAVPAEGDAPAAQAHYKIIAGERRYRAARLAGLEEVPVLVREVADETTAVMALIENIQRENLNPLEEAQGIKRLVNEFGLTHEQAAQAVGKSRSAASNLLRLLNLAEPVQTMLMAGDIDMGHARALLALSGVVQITAANQVVARKMNVREAERLVRQLSQPQPASAAQEAAQAALEKSGDVRRVEEELSDLLLAQVQVRVKKNRRQGAPISGELAVQFASLDELNGLIERLRQSA